MLANLQAGAIDDAERWLQQPAPRGADANVITLTYGLGARAEILLARGEVDAGLRLWRDAVDRLRHAGDPIISADPTGLAAWVAEAEAVTVVAHAHHGRLQLVDTIVDDLSRRLSTMLASPASSPFLAELPVAGAALLAVAMVDLVRGERTGDVHATRSGARLAALAGRFGFSRSFQPTMASARATRAAEHGDRLAYDEALRSYADLGRDELRAAAVAALAERDPHQPPGSRA